MSSPIEQASRIRAVKRICRERNLPLYPAREVVQLAVTMCRKPAVSFSGGKASLVALHLALQEDPEILVLHNDTGVEMPGTHEYLMKLKDLWGLNLHIAKPSTTFWQIVQDHGWPELRGSGDNELANKRGRQPRCCLLLKEKPFKTWLRDNGIDGNITGLQCGESRVRFLYFIERGNVSFVKTRHYLGLHPVALWTDQDLWHYIHQHKLPYHPAYDRGYKRTGCWPCTGYKNWQKTLAHSDPRMLNFILRKKGEPGLLAFIDAKAEVVDPEHRSFRHCDGG